MFGFETTIMLPLCSGLVVECGRPFYPADIAAALSRLPAPRALTLLARPGCACSLEACLVN
jgi:hypothetical protein